MSVKYQRVVAATATRANALVGALPATLETNYNVAPLTSTQVSSSIFPFSDVVESVLWAEERLAHAIADATTHPWRQYLKFVTAALANLASLPAATSGGIPIIGTWGAVIDGSSGQIYSPMPLDEVRRRAINANTAYQCTVNWYNIAAGRIEHTGTTVTIDCCGYDRAAQKVILDADGSILLADVLEPAYVAGAVSMLVRDDEFMGQAQLYRKYFDDTLAAIGQGAVSALPAMEGVTT